VEAAPSTVRVWLEPNYDHGRTGAWLLDWPGAFCWGENRDAALARVPSAINGFVEWLADHGERQDIRIVDATPIVEEVPAVQLSDGYEVNAIFGADGRTVTKDELDQLVRRLAYARDDLVELVDRLKGFAAGGGRLASDQRSPEALASGACAGREIDGVLRHLAGAETWFVSRLDPDARYDGPREQVTDYLAGSRAFLVDGLRRLFTRDPTLGRTDGKGERWTLAKAFRRSLYHSLDHLDELDRRLALAERRVDLLTLRSDAALDPAQLRHLFAAAGLGSRACDGDEVTARMLTGSTETISAWEDERLVGFARIISDETTNGYISTVAVAPRWQGRGLGRRLMGALMDGRATLKLKLDARRGVEPFYERLGFARVDTVLVRPRDTK